LDIVILANFCGDFTATNNDKYIYLAKKLALNHTVEVVTSDFLHAAKAKRRPPSDDWSFKITLLPEPGYPKSVCLKRLYSHFI